MFHRSPHTNWTLAQQSGLLESIRHVLASDRYVIDPVILAHALLTAARARSQEQSEASTN